MLLDEQRRDLKVNIMITIKCKGDWKKTSTYLTKAQRMNFVPILQKGAEKGVVALQEATPYDTGMTSRSWDYKIVTGPFGFEIWWTNSNENKGAKIAILLQYGHGTGTGGYVQGRDYINPAIKPIFDEIAQDIWKEVTRL